MAFIRTVTRGVKKLDAKFADITLRYDKAQFTANVVNKGYVFAQRRAPNYSGATRRALQKINGYKYSSLVLRKPYQKRTDPRNYHLWMHGLAGRDTRTHIKSGDPRFMFATREKMKKIAFDEYRKKLRKSK